MKMPTSLAKGGRNLNPHTASIYVLVLLLELLCGPRTFAAGGPVYAWGYDAFGALYPPGGLSTAVQVAAGNYFSMALKSDGSVAAWGDNSWGLLNVPPAATNVIAISSRGFDCLVLRGDGSLVQWGDNTYGQDNIPLTATGVVAIATGGGHHLALREDGALLAWGANNYGQCNIPLDATNIVAIDAGYTHSLVLRKDGRVLAWGEYGTGATSVPPEATNIVAISCGPDFNLALRADHTAVAWGMDWGGNLPVPDSATNVVAVSAGEMPDFVIRADGSVVAWGRNDQGELNVPVGLSPAFAIGAGNFHSLGIRVVGGVSLLRQPQDRTVRAGESLIVNIPAVGQVPVSYQWRFNGIPIAGETSPVLFLVGLQATNAGGYDLVVQNGFNSVTSRLATLNVLPAGPTITRDPTDSAVSLGGSTSFTVWAKGTLPMHCQWQRNGVDLQNETNAVLYLSSLGYGDSGLYRAVVTNVLGQAASMEAKLEVGPVFAWGTDQTGVLDLPLGLTDAVAVAAGQTHNLALKPDGTVIGWGDNQYSETVPPPDVTNITAVAAGTQFSAALRGDGTVILWGSIAEEPAGTNVAAIAAASLYTLMLGSNGTASWYGSVDSPAPPASATNLVAIAAGGSHSLGLRADGTMIGWGMNSYGQATPPASETNTLAIAAGAFFSLGLRQDGTVFQWGSNIAGEGTVPPEATNIVAISAANNHAMALRDDGRLLVWGETNLGLSPLPAALTFPSAISAGGYHDLALLDRGTLRFLRQPSSPSVVAGNATALSGWAGGPGAVIYQWLRNGTNLPGATHAYLIFPDAQQASADIYSLVASGSQGSITSQVSVLTIIPTVPAILEQPASQLAAPGGSATFTVAAKGTEPITYQWRFNGINLAGATSTTLALNNVQWTNTGTYDVVLSNAVGSVVSSGATLTFQPTVDSFDLGANNIVYALAPQPDGKVLLGGSFTSLAGQLRTNLARLNADGTLDSAFNPTAGGSASVVYSLAVQPDGGILVGGRFASMCGQSRTNLARLNRDGTLDLSFNPGPAGNAVNCLALQPDGKILLGGAFTATLGQARTNIARLMPDGTLDVAFNPGAGGSVWSLAVQSDGAILLGGNFTTLAGQPRSSIGRLNADGTLETSFNPGTPGGVYALAVQPDSRILVGGCFGTLAGQTRNYIARLNPDGTLDSGFDPGANGSVYAFALQADGKILAVGAFTSLGGQPCSFVGRISGDGAPDPTFNPPVNGTVYGLALQADGRVLAGGSFTTFNGQTRSRIARVANTDSATHALLNGGTNITWLRGAASPEICRAAFEISTNSADWLSLGTGNYASGSWQLSGVTLSANATVRARGYVTGGYQNGSTWLVEDGAGPPGISIQPISQTNVFGTNVALSVLAVGTPPFSYQWRKEGVDLVEGGMIFGSRATTLTLFGISGADSGRYSVLISNEFGSVISAAATLRVVDPLITVQPVSQATNAGQSVVFKVTAIGTAPFTYQWRRGGVALPGATASSLSLTNVQWADAGEYDVLVGNIYETNASSVATLSLPAVLDTLNPAPSGPVYALAAQTDGKILVGGDFANLGGQTRYNLGRLLPNGSLDSAFNPLPGDTVYALAVQPDGRILIGGIFPNVNWQPHAYLARIYADGSLDNAFNPVPNSNVNAVVVQPDGKILVGGAFTNLCGQSCSYLGRLNADGTLDTNFTASASGTVYSLALQPDGGMVVGGSFLYLCGQPHKYIGRLKSDGTLDTSFNASASFTVYCLLVQPDGRILVGGAFTSLCGQNRAYLGRLGADGTLDMAFNPGASGAVYSLALQADGRILAGGQFTMMAGKTRQSIGRLNPDGTLDLALNPGASSTVYALAFQSDGSILAGGNFSSFAGQPRTRLARLGNTYPAIQDLALDGSVITWQRHGACPEVWRTTVEASTNGDSWASLGSGTRIPGGWQFPADSLPANSTLLARGFVTAGYASDSSWFVESSFGPPVIRLQPTSLTNNAATLASFNVMAAGTPPLACQWYKDGVSLSDGGNISGARSSSLTVSNLLSGDAGQYWVIITNAYGSVTSLVATLNVTDPSFTTQPVSRTANADTTVSLTVQAAGTFPIAFQWYKDGSPLTDSGNIHGALTTSLTLSNVFGSNAGRYWVTITNANGALTSQAATLTVIDPLITSQPTNQFAGLGQTAVFSVSAMGTVPMGYQWRRNGASLPGATNSSLTLVNAQRADIASYDVLVTNSFSVVTSAVATLTVNLALPDSLNPGADGTVQALAVQPDGKILVGGIFNNLGGQACTNLGRLNADGTVDTNFCPNIVGGVYALAVQTDREILVGGSFWTVAGRPFTNLCRLNPDGALESEFNPGPGGWVGSLGIQSDGKILVVGYVTSLAGVPRAGMGRLNPDGTLDTSFVGSVAPTAWCMALQPDGKILAGGLLTSLGGSPCMYLGRLNADGTRDPGFTSSAGDYVYCLAVQPDGKILVGGDFTTLAGQPCNHIGRLNPNGTLENAFGPGANSYVSCIALQADGKILVGGWFTSLVGAPRAYIGRLNGDGTLDPSFNPGAGSQVNTLVAQADGATLAGGSFTTLGGQPRNYVGRLTSTDSAIQELAYSGSTITWGRSGSGPEFWRTTFESSTNRADWTDLGAGTYLPGGWRLSGISLPEDALIRARGFLTSGGYATACFVETVLVPDRAPVFVNDSLSSGSDQFGFALRAAVDQAVVIEASTNLAQWIPVQTNVVPSSGIILFTDPDLYGLPCRFYRARY